MNSDSVLNEQDLASLRFGHRFGQMLLLNPRFSTPIPSDLAREIGDAGSNMIKACAQVLMGDIKSKYRIRNPEDAIGYLWLEAFEMYEAKNAPSSLMSRHSKCVDDWFRTLDACVSYCIPNMLSLFRLAQPVCCNTTFKRIFESLYVADSFEDLADGHYSIRLLLDGSERTFRYVLVESPTDEFVSEDDPIQISRHATMEEIFMATLWRFYIALSRKNGGAEVGRLVGELLRDRTVLDDVHNLSPKILEMLWERTKGVCSATLAQYNEAERRGKWMEAISWVDEICRRGRGLNIDPCFRVYCPKFLPLHETQTRTGLAAVSNAAEKVGCLIPLALVLTTLISVCVVISVNVAI